MLANQGAAGDSTTVLDTGVAQLFWMGDFGDIPQNPIFL